MTNYILDREKLKEVLLGHKSFVAAKCRDLIREGVDLTRVPLNVSEGFTDEFIDTQIKSLPVDTILDKVEERHKMVEYLLKKMGDM